MSFLNILVFIAQNSIDGFSIVFGLNRLFFENDFYWQILTTMFLHGNFTHLLMNMVVLYQLGSICVEWLGVKRFLLLYIGGGILTSLLSILFLYSFGYNHNLVGASGALCVIIGVIARNIPHYRKGLIVLLLIMSFVPLLMGANIGWYAHLIGFGIGWLYKTKR